MGSWVPGEGSAHGRAALARYLKVAYGDASEEPIYEETFIDDAGAVIRMRRVVGVELEGADQVGGLAASSIAGGRPFDTRDESTGTFFVSFGGHGPSTVTLVFDGRSPPVREPACRGPRAPHPPRVAGSPSSARRTVRPVRARSISPSRGTRPGHARPPALRPPRSAASSPSPRWERPGTRRARAG